MRWVYLAAIVLFSFGTVAFALQNLESVTVAFLGFEGTVPIALLVTLVYILGALTGGGLLAFLRRSYAKSRWSMSGI